MLCAWPDLETAQRTLNEAPLFARYRDMAAESGTLFLQPISARGNWSGKEPFRPSLSPTGEGPIAALTRATLRPRIARRFWSRVPDINDVIGTDPNVMFKIGMGEVPALHQVTFSIWPDMVWLNPAMLRKWLDVVGGMVVVVVGNETVSSFLHFIPFDFWFSDHFFICI